MQKFKIGDTIHIPRGMDSPCRNCAGLDVTIYDISFGNYYYSIDGDVHSGDSEQHGICCYEDTDSIDSSCESVSSKKNSNLSKHTFKEGDTVRVTLTCCDAIAGREYQLHRGDVDGSAKNILIAWDRTTDRVKGGCSCEGNWTLITNKNNKTKMNKLTSKLKRLFSPSLQTQFKAGYIDDCGDITSKGRDELNMLINDDYADRLTEAAQADLDEEKESNKRS